MTHPETLENLSPTTASQPDGRGWAWTGVGAGVAGIACVVGSSMSGAVYEEDVHGDAAGITATLAEQTAGIMIMHIGAMVAALLLLVFAAGLRRYLRRVAGADSLTPQVASSALMLVSVALLMGSALTTEFVFGVKEPELLVPETAAFFGHWIGTVPWLWGGAGVAALCLGLVGRRYGTLPGWLTWTSLGLGVITTVFAISPLQYMAGMTGPLWLTVAALGILKRS